MIPTHLLPSTVLTEIKRMLEAEIIAQTGETISFERGRLVLVFSSLAATAGDVEVLEESAAAADRLQEELRIVRADRERWRLASMTYQAAWSQEVWRRPKCRLQLVGGSAEIIDITEELARERRDAGRPIGPEGGAA